MKKERIRKTFKLLFNKFGPQFWWPGDTPFEIMVGAVLTQQTAWRNVEKAIKNLKAKNKLSPSEIYRISCAELAEIIKPAGFYNLKACRLKEFVKFFVEKYEADERKMADTETLKLREELLSVRGIGKETADSILLYALNKPIFVTDAYTKRIYLRLGVLSGKETYDEIRKLFESALSNEEFLNYIRDNFDFEGDARVYVFKEMHALIVREGKEFCKKKPLCAECPLKEICKMKGGEMQ